MLFVVALLAVAVIGEAQQPAKVAKIGWLSIGLDYGPGSTIRDSRQSSVRSAMLRV